MSGYGERLSAEGSPELGSVARKDAPRRLRLRLLLTLVAGATGLGLFAPGAMAVGDRWDFRTPGEAAYCRLERNALLCITPNDGFWIRISGAFSGTVRISKGYDRRWRGFRDPTVPILAFGRDWLSSDASVLSCMSRRTGLTCRHYGGLSFWLGRYRGYRIYQGPPGVSPQVYPFFRTTNGVWCGNSAGSGGGDEDAVVLTCWRARDGTTVSLFHAQRERRLAIQRNPHARNFRPPGFPLLRPGPTFTWRCRSVNLEFAYPCSSGGSGTTVFSCRATTTTVRCENRFGRGFVIGLRGVTSV